MRAALFGFYETHSILLTIHPKARSCLAAGSVGSPPQDVSSLLRAAYAAYRASALLLGSQRSRFTLWAALGRRCSAALRLPTLGYTVDSVLRFATVASLLRYAPVAHPGLHICLSLGICAIARVFAPAHLALRAACGRLPSQRPLACVRSRSVDSQDLPTCSSFGAALWQSISTFPEGLDSPFGPTFG
jgi:hypothetical protein